MTNRIILGEGLSCDLAVLTETRMLINAASGGGKSRTIRRLAEQAHGKIQQIIIDSEGEFPTLRERYDFVIAAPHGGDCVANPRSATLLAERLLKLGVSAVINIFDLKKSTGERKRFVRLFLEAMMSSPKSLWQPVLVEIDEAHEYAPEGDESEALGPMVDLASQGRKRGYCLVAATQRLSKLSKDVAAELRNVMIGTTVLDVDMKRAADVLGFDKTQRLALRDLDSGQFWSFGPALVKAPALFTTGSVVTTHPKVGDRKALPAPPPTAKIRALLPQLADLPAEAEEKARTEAELRKELATARATITRMERSAPTRDVEKVVTQKVSVLKEADVVRVEVAAGRVVERIDTVAEHVKAQMTKVFEHLSKDLTDAASAGVARIEDALNPIRAKAEKASVSASLPVARPTVMTRSPGAVLVPARALPISRPESRSENGHADSNGTPLKKGAREILGVACRYAMMKLSRSQLLQLAGGRSRKSSTSDVYLADLKRRALLEVVDGFWSATDAGFAEMGITRDDAPVGPEELRRAWDGVLKAGERAMLDAVMAAPGIDSEGIARATNYSNKSSTFDVYMASLRRNGLVTDRGGRLYPSEALVS